MEKEKLVSLVVGVQKGDDRAVTEMYNAFHDDIYYYIFKTVNDSELAADLTQDTFIEILQSIGSLQEPAAFITWSRQIAYRRCTAYFKKRHDILADEDEDGYSIFDTIAEERTEFIPDEALDKEDLKKTIHGIINELPEEQRAVIMMRYFDELSVVEIAEIQGVSEGTVKSRLNYGRKAIGKSVEAYEKKHNIKLHCAGVIPLLLWLLREYRLANGLSLTTGAASATAAHAVAGTATTTAATATAAATTTAAVAAKTVGGALIAKIVAGIVAASVAIGGVALGVTRLNQAKDKSSNDTPQFTKPKTECDHLWHTLAWYPTTLETSNPAGILGYDQICQECGVVEVGETVRASDDCQHSWQATQLHHPYVVYTRGHCQTCNGYDILEFSVNACKHILYQDHMYRPEYTECSECGYICEHPEEFLEWTIFEEDGRMEKRCNGCGFPVDVTPIPQTITASELLNTITCYVGYGSLTTRPIDVVTVYTTGNSDTHALMTSPNCTANVVEFLPEKYVADTPEECLWDERSTALYYCARTDAPECNVLLTVEFVSRSMYQRELERNTGTHIAADGRIYYVGNERDAKPSYLLDIGMTSFCVRLTLSGAECTLEDMESVYFALPPMEP